MTPVSHGKPCAGNPHARFDEGASAPEDPRRKALLHNTDYLFFFPWLAVVVWLCVCAFRSDLGIDRGGRKCKR